MPRLSVCDSGRVFAAEEGLTFVVALTMAAELAVEEQET